MTRAKLTLGTAQFGGPYGIARDSRALGAAEAESILATALELDIDCLDTSPQYGGAESLIGEFFAHEPGAQRLAVCTKLPGLPAALNSDEIDSTVRVSLDASRRRLRRDRIDYYLVHSPEDLLSYGQVLVDALTRARDAGWVDRIGVSIYDPAEAETALAQVELTAIQLPFNVFDRRMKDAGCLDTAVRNGVRTFARSALLQGLLVLAPQSLPAKLAAARPHLERFGRFAGEAGMSPHALAIAYVSSQGLLDDIVLGVDSADQLRESVGAMRRSLPSDLREAIEREFDDIPPEVIDPRCWARA